MKLHTKLTVIGSVAALVTSPIAFANKGAAAKPDAAEVQDSETEPEVVICEEAPNDDGVKGGKDTTDETVTEEVTDDSGAEEPVANLEDGEAIPLDWVKRGGGENPEIFQNMAGGEAPVFKNDNAATKELGQNEKATDIESQDAPVAAQINRQKKAPVALVKKGRVFLR